MKVLTGQLVRMVFKILQIREISDRLRELSQLVIREIQYLELGQQPNAIRQLREITAWSPQLDQAPACVLENSQGQR